MNEKTGEIAARKVRTPKFRLSYPHLFEAHTAFEGQEAKFSLTMLFPKTTDLGDLKRAAQAAVIQKWGPDKAKWPKNLALPFGDGDKPTVKGNARGEECKGHVVVPASSKQRPGVVDQKLAAVTADDDSIYAGCFCRATLIAYAYDKAGNRGVGFALQNVQKLADGDRFGGRKAAAEDFDAVEDNSDSPESYGDSESTGEESWL